MLDEHGNLKISDFGLSSLYIGDAEGSDGASRTELLHTTCGTPNYVAPEVLSDQGYDGKKADVWSCGVIVYVLLAGFLPFDESTIVALFAKIQSADFTYPSWFTPEVRALLDRMLVADPKVRITLSEIKNNAWFIGGENAAAAGGSTPSAAPAPTAEEVEAAVQNAADDAGAGEDLEDAAASSGIVSLNAFDLVSHCGGFMLDKMFSPEIFYSVGGGASDQPGPALSADTKKASFSGALLFGGTVKSKTYHFSASAISPHDLTRAVVDALEGMGFDMEGTGGGKDAILHSGVIKCSLLSAKGLVGMFVQVFELSPNMCLLEIRKGKGDLLEWNTAYSELIDKRLAHLLNKAK